ncbi:MAG TPA: GspE/PulE family protein [Thermoanaerobaculia bacterium]|nr:GspE/PulE family protein [Thermoanaerobaculia bacterium]HUM29846.1 GspE/PulE family protein [Thermoanaerobaculia bacterium]HXK68121.1 GspE/PulE family protein [Thermoanaerobaculia bacterium]
MTAQANEVQSLLQFKESLTEIINQIHGAQNIKEIIVDLKTRILDLLGAERITIYAIDTKNQQLYSLYKEGEELKEIRVPRNFASIVGFCALSRQTVRLKNAYDPEELKALHPKLDFDSSWDKKSGFTTAQVLAAPILYDKYIMGVLQLLNKKGGGEFTNADQAAAQEIAKTLGIAFYNQRRITRAQQPNKYGYLIDKGLISEKNLEDAVSYARMNNQEISHVLVEKYRIAKEEVLKSLGQFFNSGHFVFDGTQMMPEEFRQRLNPEYLKKVLVAPLSKKGGTVQVAMEDPTDLAKIDIVRMMQLAPRHECLVAIPRDIQDYINTSYGIEETEVKSDLAEILGELEAETEEVVDEDALGVDEADNAIVRLANQIIKDAYQQGASDIHVEPYGKKMPTRIRFRIDGVCHVYQEIPATHRNAVISRLKIMSNLDISERRKPQDGKIRFRMKTGTIELRVATIPTTGSEEDIVMRILAASKPIPLEKMGFSERNLSAFYEVVSKPYGIVLCVGPTGSGKTTTLHSALGYINTPERKIWTAEDPVEITQPGLRQVQVHPKIGFTFAAAMRSFLRADPDVIMVGEMRDQETAHIGVEASLTGHLVLSTLHTNSAPETITRLLDMDIDPFNFADSLLGILAQRLIRTLCKSCKESYNPSREEFESMAASFGREALAARQIEWSPDMTLYKPVGCPECAGTGYRGRMGLHELLVGTDEVKRLIQQKSVVEEIRNQAISDGMTTLMQDGIIKVLQGSTDMKQVRAVCIR